MDEANAARRISAGIKEPTKPKPELPDFLGCGQPWQQRPSDNQYFKALGPGRTLLIGFATTFNNAARAARSKH